MPRLRKLYLDLVADDGSVCIAYVASLHVAGLRLAPAGIEHYAPDGTRTIRRGRASLSLETESPAEIPRALRFDFDGRTCTFDIEPEQKAMIPAVAPPPGFTWSVRHARNKGRLRGFLDVDHALEGTGYADWVDLTRLPRALGLERLQWGRVHLATGTAIYTWVERAHEPVWRSATWWPRGAPPEALARWSLVTDGNSGATVLGLHVGGRAREIAITPVRALHRGSAVDGTRFPSCIERTISRWVSGPTSENRWLGRAQTHALGDGWAVYESVRFGGDRA